MAKSRELKRRIRAVANTQRITKTMQMIATARLQAAQKRATAAQPFTRKVRELVGELSSAAPQGDFPLLKPVEPAAGKTLILVITSNRGLCGGYNAGVLRAAAALLKQDPKADLEVVGKKGMAYFRFTRREVSKFHGHITDRPTFEEIEALAESYMKGYSGKQYDAVQVVYVAFESMSRQRPVSLKLLPLEKPATSGTASGKGTADYEFSPDAKSLLEELLPMSVKVQLYQCFMEAAVSEHLARRAAMKSATDAAGKMAKELTRRYNRARQAAITTELTEIVAGAAALGG